MLAGVSDIANVTALPYVYNDGGRAGAGYTGEAGDCVTRAIAIATGTPYQTVYDALATALRAGGKAGTAASPRNGVPRKVYERYLLEVLGWEWVPCMHIGQGATHHLRCGSLPGDRPLVVRVSKHLCAVVGGVVQDTHDPTREGTRCVYGYYQPKGGK